MSDIATISTGRQVAPARDCGLNMNEVLQAIPGLTVRQYNYWARSGRIHLHYHLRGLIVQQGGHGSQACWPHHQVDIARRMLRLVHRGIDVDTAHTLATNPDVLGELLSELTKIEAELDDQRTD